MLGEYDFSEEKLQDTSGILPPKIDPQNHSAELGAANSVKATSIQTCRERPMVVLGPMLG